MFLFSIIIPTKNSGKLLEQSLLSIKKQLWCKTEILIVDQQSEDDTLRIAREFKAKIIVINKSKYSYPYG
jgi:glycosyltransferase involved in cell wall biosynthesis